MSDSSISHRMLRGDVELLLKKWPRPGKTNTLQMIPVMSSIPPPAFHPDVCGLTGHGAADISRRPGSGLSMRWAELVQGHRRLVAVAQQHPLAAGGLTHAQTLNIQHNAVHTGQTGLGTDGPQSRRQLRSSCCPGRPLTGIPSALRMLSLQMGQVQCSFSHGSTHIL